MKAYSDLKRIADLQRALQSAMRGASIGPRFEKLTLSGVAEEIRACVERVESTRKKLPRAPVVIPGVDR